MKRLVAQKPWSRSDEQRLSSTLVEFARTLVFNYSTQDILDRLVASVIEVLGVTGAGVVLRGSDEQMHFIAASDKVILRIEHLQLELGEGPCLTASETGEPVLITDLATDDRFARFSPRAAEAGMAAVFTFPLRGEGASIGALDIYSDTPRGLSAQHRVAAQILADVASVYVSNARSRAETQRSEDQLRHRLLHDALTGLPNRMLLDDRLKQAVAAASRSGRVTGVLFLDLDHFKSVNDTFGHRTGDLLLVSVADRLRDILRPGDTLARLAGDEFVVICEDLEDISRAEDVAARIVATVSNPFLIDSHRITIGVSVGVAHASPVAQGIEALLHADAAMYDAKLQGGGRFQTVDDRLQTSTDRRHGVERDLLDALEGDELRLHFQPIVSVTTGQWDGVEALLRWDHPRVGAVAPETIVAAAERAGLALELGSWVTRTACRQMREWMDSGGSRPASIAVNVSAPELLHPLHCSRVEAAIRECGLPPDALCLEITESILVADARAAVDVLKSLKRIGVTLALDDFGTGYSSLNYLKRFPVSVVKIDRTFIADLAEDPVDEAIVIAVIELAHRLGLTVVAEGVETSDQRDHVVSLGCDHIQGYLYSHPVGSAEMPATAPWAAGLNGHAAL